MSAHNTPHASPKSSDPPTTSEPKGTATRQLDKLADQAGEKLGEVADQAERFAGRMIESGREVGDQVKEVTGHLRGAVDKSVREQPIATLAVAAIIGFVLGAVWKS